MQVVLVTFKADGERRSFSLPKDITVIGRREDCDIRIPLGEVSRKHCRLIIEVETLRVEDMGSSNGTFLNGARVQEAVVQPGDALQVGSVVFVVQMDGIPADEEIQPVSAAESRGDTKTGGPGVQSSDGGAGAEFVIGNEERSTGAPIDEVIDLD
ncbi:MAG: FHA domain-containing protein, partial [Planctomycetota bacterium]|nr:FHA domain-containing protein [Planctomycetota bacterium]